MTLYLHIPFCDSKCSYCAFNSYVDQFHLKSSYMTSIIDQLHFELKKFGAKKNSIDSVFIGGGTPSTVEPKLYIDFFNTVLPYLKIDAEITVEANPNSSTFDWLKEMRLLGVNRVSFGVQSFNEDKLKFLGRAHHSSQAIDAVLNAKKAGFNHVSIDIIYNVLGDTYELLKNDIDRDFSLPIDHISAYSLTIEDGTKFQNSPDVAYDNLELTKYLFELITSHGFKQYEISNFGKYYSKHNIGYWEHKNYIGIGSGAVGFFDNRRFYPSTDISSYINDPLFQSVESLTNDDIKIEKIFLGFRSYVGVDKDIFNLDEMKRANMAVDEKKLTFRKGRYFNSDYLLSDEIALFITS